MGDELSDEYDQPVDVAWSQARPWHLGDLCVILDVHLRTLGRPEGVVCQRVVVVCCQGVLRDYGV